ncbi:MAG: tRNA (5-methylaminomethyl-2-thiouridine)(34)-methyltransferase MnmD, partial [Pseudomonadota bacterium]|nr:tRNA (5-methylaminomethyl-2-thiouridine)(34)-methyltransferase MnmD [Pseudomonadota bacterium]
MAAQSPHLGADYDLPRADLAFRDGVPFAAAFDDGYYNADDGLAESRHVFLDGNGLSARMRELRHLTIAETGFGTGLNLLAVMAEMNRHPELRLDYISFEGFPLTAEQMEQAHAPFTAVAAEAAALRAALPPRWPGYHLVQLCGGRLTLHLHYGEIGDMLPSLDFRADCWFLDGFAPARNPSMWTAENLSHVGRLTRPGGSLASFTAAGDVRRSLEAAGFAVERVPGYGRKRQMIRGRRSGDRDDQPMPPSRIAVIGGGIAGAAAAAGLRRRGAEVVLLEAGTGIGEGASGNRMALQSPRLTIDHNAMSRLSAACLSFAARLSDLSGATMAKGVLALDAPERMAARHHVFRGQAWPVDLLRAAGPEDLPASVDESGSAIVYPFGRVIRPDMLLPCLMGDTQLVSGFEVASIDAGEDSLLIAAKDGRQRQADAVVLASGADLGQMMA